MGGVLHYILKDIGNSNRNTVAHKKLDFLPQAGNSGPGGKFLFLTTVYQVAVNFLHDSDRTH